MSTATTTTVADVAAVTTEYENAFMDALHCMYFLMKREIAHTTSFAELQYLCILLGKRDTSYLTHDKLTICQNRQWPGTQSL